MFSVVNFKIISNKIETFVSIEAFVFYLNINWKEEPNFLSTL